MINGTTEPIEAIRKIINVFSVNALANNYAIENIVMGFIQPHETIPFDKYVEDLQLQLYHPHEIRGEMLEGFAITADETIQDKDNDSFIYEFYAFQMNNIFESVRLHKNRDDDDILFPFKHKIKEYILSLYPLLKSVLNTKVSYDFFDVAPLIERKSERTKYYETVSKFLVAIKTRGLRQGSCVDRYLKDLPFLPYFTGKLVKKQKGRYILSNSDTESIDYKLALLCVMRFMNEENARIFELKARAYELEFSL